MSEWNVPKIREECLKLMGWKHDPTLGLWGGPFVNWRDPSGKHVLESGIPDPTTSLDDALPLMEKYGVAPRKFGKWTSIPWDSAKNIQEADTAPLSVCLCALLCAGHNLDDFRVKS